MRRLSIGIVGGSVGGLCAAALLRADGHDVTVFERSAHRLDGRGAGLVAQAEVFETLQVLGIPASAVPGVPAHERVVLGRRGTIAQRAAAVQTQLSWDRLWLALRDRLPDRCYRRAAAVAHVASHENGAEITLGDGQRFWFDVVVGADGAGSVAREAVAADDPANTYVGYAIWRGLVPESALPAEAADVLFDRMSFYTGPGEHAVGYLVPGAASETMTGERRYNWVWYRDVPWEKLSQIVAASGRPPGATGLGPGQLPAVLGDHLRATADRVLPPPLAAAVGVEPAPFLQGVLEYVAPRMALERVALIGDAAAVARPHTAMGVAKAFEDAAALASALRQGSPSQALRDYDKARLPIVRDIVAYGRDLARGLPLASTPSTVIPRPQLIES